MAKYKLQEMGDMRYDGKRRVYPKMVTNRTLSRKEFVKMMLSKAGQSIVAKDGYVPVPAKVVQADLKKLGIM